MILIPVLIDTNTCVDTNTAIDTSIDTNVMHSTDITWVKLWPQQSLLLGTASGSALNCSTGTRAVKGGRGRGEGVKLSVSNTDDKAEYHKIRENNSFTLHCALS